MAKLAALAILLLFSIAEISLSSAKKPSAAAARREDIPFIRCQVCHKIAEQIYNQVEKKQAQISPKKVSEYQIIEIAENVCNLKKEEADWILQIDIVEKGDKLELVEQGTEGLCNSECKTIERACQEIIGYSDTDVAEFVYKHRPSVDKLANVLCKDLSDACSKSPPPVPKDRIPGEAFVAKPAKDAEMEKIMRSMEGMPGAPSMKMYSRDDIMNNRFGDEDGDDEDDDDEDKFPGKLGNILREKESSKKDKDLKQKILQGVKDAGKVVKGHVNKVSKQLGSWWRGKKTSTKTSKKGKSEL
ncbi:uncharacterized protein LOC109847110 [Asparagus officinalis]|uniref:uncharacterized protein LOC109847110 n=1 Tax=Asparagus officinalis TaxID=4686 RepID=UPI00098DFD21|nr:uncharacterized protein LOC109847110 [Asparagus officinalis]